MPVFQTDSFQGDALGGDIAAVTGAGLCDTLGGLNFGGMLFWATTGLGIYTSLWNDSRELPAVPSWVLQASGAPATLDIDFVHNLAFSSPSATTVPGLLTCSRASTGYYQNAEGVLSSFGNNVLRYGDNGLLAEESRTNLLLQSNTFGTTWTATNLTNLTSTTAGPDAVAGSGTLLNETTTSGNHGVNQSVTKAASALAYAFTVYAKQGAGRTRIALKVDDGGGTNGAQAVYDLAGGQVGVAAAGTGTPFTALGSSITALANGWYRCEIDFTTGTGTTLACHVFDDSGSSTGAISISYAGVVSDGCYIFGAQLEQASFGLSYIPTTTGTVTRAEDNITLTSITPITVAAGTWYLQFNIPNVSAFHNGIGYAPNSGVNSQSIWTCINSDLFSISQTSFTNTANTVTANATQRGAASYDNAGNTAVVLNGGTVATGTGGSFTGAGFTGIQIGSSVGGGNDLDGYLRRLTFWNSKITGAPLQTLSTIG